MAYNLVESKTISVETSGENIRLKATGDFGNENVVVGSIRSKNMFDIQTMYSASTGGANTDITPSNNAKITSITNSSVSFTTSSNWNGIACNYIKVEPSTDYILSFQTTSTTNEMFVKVCFYDSSKTFIYDTYATGNLNFSITTTSTTKYVKVIIEKINSSSSAITLSNIQLEEGDTATTYSPYFSPANEMSDKLSQIAFKTTDMKFTINQYSGINLNNLADQLGVSFIYGTSLTNAPVGALGYIITICILDPTYAKQYFMAPWSGSPEIYTRTKDNGTWSSWYKINAVAL